MSRQRDKTAEIWSSTLQAEARDHPQGPALHISILLLAHLALGRTGIMVFRLGSYLSAKDLRRPLRSRSEIRYGPSPTILMVFWSPGLLASGHFHSAIKDEDGLLRDDDTGDRPGNHCFCRASLLALSPWTWLYPSVSISKKNSGQIPPKPLNLYFETPPPTPVE